ncbi:MAG: hypothetical protein WCY26_08640 [Thiohalobacteraceae bacterium]
MKSKTIFCHGSTRKNTEDFNLKKPRSVIVQLDIWAFASLSFRVLPCVSVAIEDFTPHASRLTDNQP